MAALKSICLLLMMLVCFLTGGPPLAAAVKPPANKATPKIWRNRQDGKKGVGAAGVTSPLDDKASLAALKKVSGR